MRNPPVIVSAEADSYPSEEDSLLHAANDHLQFIPLAHQMCVMAIREKGGHN